MIINNNDPMVHLFSIVLMTVFVIVGLLLLYKYFNDKKLYKEGTLGNKRVSKRLDRYAKVRNFKVMHNVTISDEKESVVIDHILIGFFGIMLIRNLQGMGDYYGANTANEWTFKEKLSEKDKDKPKLPLKNPLLELETAQGIIKRRLAKQSIYNMLIEEVVLFSADGKVIYNGEKNTKLMSYAFWKNNLKNSSYQKDNEVDVEAMCKLLA